MYHCVIKDILTGDVLGDHMADRITKELVINAILAMLARHEIPEGCIFHSEQRQPVYIKSCDGIAATVRAAPELLSCRGAG